MEKYRNNLATPLKGWEDEVYDKRKSINFNRYLSKLKRYVYWKWGEKRVTILLEFTLISSFAMKLIFFFFKKGFVYSSKIWQRISVLSIPSSITSPFLEMKLTYREREKDGGRRVIKESEEGMETSHLGFTIIV